MLSRRSLCVQARWRAARSGFCAGGARPEGCRCLREAHTKPKRQWRCYSRTRILFLTATAPVAGWIWRWLCGRAGSLAAGSRGRPGSIRRSPRRLPAACPERQRIRHSLCSCYIPSFSKPPSGCAAARLADAIAARKAATRAAAAGREYLRTLEKRNFPIGLIFQWHAPRQKTSGRLPNQLWHRPPRAASCRPRRFCCFLPFSFVLR